MRHPIQLCQDPDSILRTFQKTICSCCFTFSNKVYSKPPDIAVPWFQKKRKCHHSECEATVATRINPNQIKAEKTGEGDGVSVCWWNKRTLLSVSPLLTTFPCCHFGLNPQTWWKEGNAEVDYTLPSGCSSKIIWRMFYGISATFTAENFTHNA